MDKHYVPDERKDPINELYSGETRKFIGRDAHCIILDTSNMHTTNALNTVGVPNDRIVAPNINKADCDELERAGIHSPHMMLDEYIDTTDRKFNSLWHDSMTTPSGSEKNRDYPFMPINRFLLMNQCYPGKKCVVALTVSTRSNQVRAIHRNNKYTTVTQMRRLAATHGFVVKSCVSRAYKFNMLFVMMSLVYNPAETCGQKKKLLSWKRFPKRLIGFSRGFQL